MPVALPWIIGAVGLGAAGGYVAGVKTSDALMWAAIAAGLYYVAKG